MTSQSEDPHAQRKREEENMKNKAQELKEAGVNTAHSALKEGEKSYENTKVRMCSDQSHSHVFMDRIASDVLAVQFRRQQANKK